jgi:hypothetical protein
VDNPNPRDSLLTVPHPYRTRQTQLRWACRPADVQLQCDHGVGASDCVSSLFDGVTVSHGPWEEQDWRPLSFQTVRTGDNNVGRPIFGYMPWLTSPLDLFVHKSRGK